MMKTRDRLFSVITMIGSVLLTLVVFEVGLRWYESEVVLKDTMTPGLLRYDARFGWRTAANWRGRHTHHDYEATYTTNALGHRDATASIRPGRGDPRPARLLVYGDSYTFGLGVGDRATFAARLAAAWPSVDVINAGVPGTATDQQVLYIEDDLPVLEPDAVVLAVYLGNDINDLAGPFPAQAALGKPWFSLEAKSLRLHNVPVPRTPKPAHWRTPLDDLATGYLANLRLLRRLGITAPGASIEQIETVTAPGIRTFLALVERARVAVAPATFQLVLLPGKSLVYGSGSTADRYQASLGTALTALLPAEADVIDTRPVLSGCRACFFPNDGHLTTQGHERVAALLSTRLRPPSPLSPRR